MASWTSCINQTCPRSWCLTARQSAAGRRGGLGEVVRPGVQHQGGGGGHQRGRLPLPGCVCGTVRRPEAPPGPALLRILCLLVPQTFHLLMIGELSQFKLSSAPSLQYMMILFVVFVLQFAVSCACLSLNADQQV